jgi:hypothetical protein
VPSVATTTPATASTHVASPRPARARPFMAQRVRPVGGAVAGEVLLRVNRYHDV